MSKRTKEISIIKDKISKLRKSDKSFKIFGAESHKYEFQSKISEDEILNFERKHEISLPSSYRNFLLEFGNGGCGPYYGILKLQQGVLDIPNNPKESDTIDLSKQFRFDTLWNLECASENDFDLWEQEYDESKWCDGMLRICHEGCGYYINLVITGKERGNLWVDARVSEQGIFPINYFGNKKSIGFLEWYMNWLDNSIKELT